MPAKRKRSPSRSTSSGMNVPTTSHFMPPPFCLGCQSNAIPVLHKVFMPVISKQRTRTRVGDIIDAIQTAESCLLCRFFMDTVSLYNKDSPYRIPSDSLNTDTGIFLVADPEPWFSQAGIQATTPSCPYAWFEIGSYAELLRPLICVSFEPTAQDGSGPQRQANRVYPRRRPFIEAHNGSCNPKMIQKWLQKCDKQHVQCKQREDKLPQNLMLIDVNTRCLAQYQPGDQFLTLSYVWGRGALQQRYWLEPENISPKGTLRHESGCALPASLPQTIEDAIQLVKKLERQYLWVDLICINQLDEVGKQDHIEARDAIFASSWLTIVCADGPHADYGLPGTSRYISQTRQPTVITPLGRMTANYVHSARNQFGVSEWDRRAWTLQERLLSRRCLYFADTHYSMICREENFHELVDTNVENLELTLHHAQERFREDGSDLDLDVAEWNFATYGNWVSIFTGRNITDQNDILNACRGSLKRLATSTGCDFHFGLPKHELLQTLLWIPHYGNQLVRRFGFPSWSWLGWKGRSEYPYWLHYKNNDEYHPQLMPVTMQLVVADETAFRHSNGRLSATFVHDRTMTAPVIQLKTVICDFQVRLVMRSGGLLKPTPAHVPKEAIGDQWALVKHDNSELLNHTQEFQHLNSTPVSIRLDPEQSKLIEKLKNQVYLVFIKYWPYIWDEENSVLKHRVSCLVMRKDMENCYHRLACVLIAADEWLLRDRTEEVITLV